MVISMDHADHILVDMQNKIDHKKGFRNTSLHLRFRKTKDYLSQMRLVR